MQKSKYGYTNIDSEYLIYPFTSPIEYNVNYTGTYSKYSIVDKFYLNSLVKPTKRLYYGGAEWVNTDPIALTFSVSNLAYSFADEVLFKEAISPNISISSPDPSYDRIDAIVVNEDGDIKIISGVPALEPKKPVLGEDEILIQYALVKAGVSKIGECEIVYENNSQWQTNTYQISGLISGSVNFNSTNNQYNSTSCVSANTDYRTGINFKKLTGSIDKSQYGSLSMRVRINNDLDQNRFLSAQIYGTSSSYLGTASSNTINLMAYGLDSNTIGTWQHIVLPTSKFGSNVEHIIGLKMRMIGGLSASNTSWDLDYVLFQTGIDYDQYTDPSNATYTTTSITSGGSGSGGSLTVEDYLTGQSYVDINKIVFRGNTVVIPGGMTATGVTVTEDQPATPGSIMVWIPAPNYVGYFSPSFTYGSVNRYIMEPTTNNHNSSGPAGEYSIGSWSVSGLFNAGTTKSVKTTSGVHTAFTATAFSCFDLNTTLTFTLYDGAGNEIRTTGPVTVNSITSVNSSPTGITLNITSFDPDNDRYKAVVNGVIDVNSVFPNGGRFSWKIVHVNSGNGPGANNVGSPTLGIYSYTSNDMVYDIDLSDGSSSANISGSVLFDEKTTTLRYYSGVSFYSIGSVFGFTVSGINLLNDITIPTTKQIDIVATNMAITSTHDGYADGSKITGSAITGWTYSWDASGLTYSKDGSVNQIDQYVPDYTNQTTNTLNVSNLSNITSRLYDSGQADSASGVGKYMLFDTDTISSVSHIDNPLDSENGRLSFSGLSNITGSGVHPLSGTISGSATFSSNISLVTAVDELQYIFGRVIYPQHDFTTYFPLVNQSASVDYSSLLGVSKNFDIYTYDGLVNGTGATTTENLSGYRWHVTSYSKTVAADVSFTSGIFTFWSNFEESDLHWAYPTTGSDYSGSEDLVILVGIDSTGNNLTPDKFMFITGQSSTYGARVSPGTYNFNATSPSSVKKLQWSIGTLPVNVRKVWLFVAYKENSVRAKNLWMTNINLTT